MKKFKFFLLVLGVLGLASCAGDKEPTKPQASNLSSIEADPEILVNGQWVEFEVEETTMPTPGYRDQRVFWYVNNNQILPDSYSKDGNEYKTWAKLDGSCTEVNVKVEIVYYYTSEEVRAVKEQVFSVQQPDVHQFLWGNSKDVVEKNLGKAILEEDNSLVYLLNSQNWSQFSSGKEVTAVYDFNSAEKLIKVSEGFKESIDNATDVTYQKLVYNYVAAYNDLSKKYGMPEIGGEWLSQPTNEEIDAVDKVLNDYKNSSKELRTIVGKLIADGKLELITTSNGNTNTKVELSVYLNNSGAPFYMMVFTPNN